MVVFIENGTKALAFSSVEEGVQIISIIRMI